MKKLILVMMVVVCSFSFSTVNPITFKESQKKEVVDQVKEYSKNKWEKDYSMISWEFKRQIGAFKWLVNKTEDDEILNSAFKKWGEDYGMVKWEYERQEKSKSESIGW